MFYTFALVVLLNYELNFSGNKLLYNSGNWLYEIKSNQIYDSAGNGLGYEY